MKRKGMTMYICFTLFFITSFVITYKSIAANEQVTINAADLYIRSGAAQTSSVIAKVNREQTLKEWGAASNVKIIASMNKKTASVSASSLNIRKSPSLNGDRIGSLGKNEVVEVVQEQGDWTQIETNGLKGWVHSEYLTIGSTSSSTGSSSKDTLSTTHTDKTIEVSGIVTASTLYVKNKGSLHGKVIGSVTKGMQVSILKEKNDWYKIAYSSNKTGWVAGWFISIIGNNTRSNLDTTSKRQAKIIYNGTNIRKGPSTSYSIVKRANLGESYKIIQTVGDWYKIKLGTNKTGYIAGWVVEASGIHSPVIKPGSAQYVKNKTIVIDPGHGGQDSGAVGSRGTLEKNVTLSTAKLLYNKLESAGANVFITRSNDTYISLNSRVSTSHYRNAKAFISMHFDSTTDRSVNGTTSYYYNSLKDAPLASKINTELVKQSNLKDRGMKFGNFYVIRENKAPAALLELGFLSNRTEELTINTSSYQERISHAIFYGLAKYFK